MNAIKMIAVALIVAGGAGAGVRRIQLHQRHDRREAGVAGTVCQGKQVREHPGGQCSPRWWRGWAAAVDGWPEVLNSAVFECQIGLSPRQICVNSY